MAKTISRDDVLKLANLARIEISDDEIDGYINELNEIIEYVKQLASIDFGDTKPTNQVTGLVNVWRDDEIIDYGFITDELLKDVPHKLGRFIKVNRMI